MVRKMGWPVLMGMGLLLAACESGTNSGGGVAEADLIGKWDVKTVHTKGRVLDDNGDPQDVDSIETYPSGAFTMEYKSDKTFSQGVAPLSVNGTWSIKGDSVITVITIFGFTDTTASHVRISGSQGTFTEHFADSEEDYIETTVATKQ